MPTVSKQNVWKSKNINGSYKWTQSITMQKIHLRHMYRHFPKNWRLQIAYGNKAWCHDTQAKVLPTWIGLKFIGLVCFFEFSMFDNNCKFNVSMINYLADPVENWNTLFFDMTCDMDRCATVFTSLSNARIHYLNVHSIPNGYVKCCDMKLKTQIDVNDHIAWHKNPASFRFTFFFEKLFIVPSNWCCQMW